jgi:hypothetical protein
MVNALPALMALAMLGMAAGADAETAAKPEVDKSVFNLINPTPAQYLRAMDTDGPGSTESPYTVDAGHFQIEMTLAGYTYDRESFNGLTERFEAWSIAPMNLKIGLLNQLDAQLLLEPYTVLYERVDRSGGTQPGSRTTTLRGFGDTTVRLKYNFWGNDDGRTAFAATPYLKFPTSQDGIGNRGVEGGLILPLAVELPRAFYLGVTTRFDAVRDEDESGYHPEFVNSVAFGHDLFGSLFGYVEFYSAVSAERDADWVGTFDTGLIYELTESVQLNAGVNIGVTRSADDWNAFVGLAWRF